MDPKFDLVTCHHAHVVEGNEDEECGTQKIFIAKVGSPANKIGPPFGQHAEAAICFALYPCIDSA